VSYVGHRCANRQESCGKREGEERGVDHITSIGEGRGNHELKVQTGNLVQLVAEEQDRFLEGDGWKKWGRVGRSAMD